MKINYVELEISGNTDIHTVDAMHRFWEFFYRSALNSKNSLESKLDSAIIANRNWKPLEDDEFTGGFGFPSADKPFSDSEIENIKERLKEAIQQFKEAEQMYNYFMRYMFNKMHDQQSQ